MNRKHKGFTLLELIIAVALLSMLAISAIPYYFEPVLTTHQASAKLALYKLANDMQQYFSIHHTYKDITLEKLGYKADVISNYELAIITSDVETFKIAAIPKKPIKKDECGTFFLDQDGYKTISGEGSGCW